MSILITGLFDTPIAAQAAADLLKQDGYASSEFSIIIKDASEQPKEGSVVVAVAAHSGDEERVHSVLQTGASAASGHIAPVDVGQLAPIYAVPLSTSSAIPKPRQEHAPIRVPILDEIRAGQMAAVEHERDARREALLASPLAHDEVAIPTHPTFTGLEHTPKSS